MILGGLALVVQLWLVFRFEQMMRIYWGTVAQRFGGSSALSNRMSQLKPAPFKAPWSWIYFGLFLALTIGVLAWMWSAGIRAAASSTDEEPPSSS